MDSCVFCDIVNGKIPSHKVWEDDEFVAFLGIFPKNAGMTVVVTKKHYGSYIFETLGEEEFLRFHKFAKMVALRIDKSLGSERCIQVMEGLEVDHAHLKLFPVYKNKSDHMGEGIMRASEEELEEIAAKIKNSI